MRILNVSNIAKPCLFLFLVYVPTLSQAQKTESQKPNILFIMSDDHTTQAVGAYGSRLARLNPTPVIDELARQGMTFDNCLSINSICTPSRAAIITGQYCQRNGVLDLDGRIPQEKQYLPKQMQQLGYQTAMIGKWHLKDEPGAFDYYCVLPGQGLYFDPIFRIQGNNWPNDTIQTQGHSSDVITDLTLEWLENIWEKGRPFFLMHHYKAPHDMFEFAPRYKSYLENTFIPEPASLYFNANHGSKATRGVDDALIHDLGSSVSHRNKIRNMGMHMDIDSTIADPQYAHLAYQEYLKRYLRCVKGVDDNIGRLMTYLDTTGLLANTVIIYTGDQGFMLGEHDYIDKRWMYEESLRMPFIVRYPDKVQAGSRTDAIINNTDIAPTIIELGGGTVPSYMQGRSFRQILETGVEPENWPKASYYRYWMHMAHRHANPAHFGIRTKEYKLIFFYGRFWKDVSDPANLVSWGNRYTFETPPGWELYDLVNDPFEMNNVYNRPDYSMIQQKLKVELARLRSTLEEEDHNFPHIEQIIARHWSD